MEFTLLWAALTAVAAGWIGLRIWDERVPDEGSDRLMLSTLVGLAGGRLAAMIGQGINPITNPADIIVIRGGVSTVAATTLFLATLLWTTRSTPVAPDAMTPAILFALAGWHTGCIWRGACLGTASDLPWAWSQSGSALSRHPVEIYAAIGLVLAAWLVGRLGWRPWLRLGSGLALASLVRLATEPMRPSLTGGPVRWYVAGVVVGGVLVLVGPKVMGRVATDST